MSTALETARPGIVGSPGGGPRPVSILVVDDLPHKLTSIRAVLEELEGLEIVTAQSGPEALRRIMERDFALILLDVHMPDMDGFETAALIRQRRRFAHVPIMFLTAYADEMRLARGYSLGAVDYILAPIVPEVLRTKVSVFAELYRKTEEVRRHGEERIALAKEQAARAQAEEAGRRSRFLAEAVTLLGSSLDLRPAIPKFLRMLVPFLADHGVLVLLDEHGQPVLTELASKPASGVEVETQTWRQELDALPLGPTIRRVLATGEPVALTGELSLPALGSAIVLPLLARGRTLGALGLGLHSDRRLAFADLELAEELAERAAVALDNARLYREVQERDRRNNEFLSTLAHELRNPLAPIRNAVEIIKLKPRDPDVERVSAIIDRQLEHVVRMVDDLLDVARITRGKINLQKEPVDVAGVMARAVETAKPLIDARKHELTISTPDAPLMVYGDQARLVQILTNLLNNAAKYTKDRGRIWLSAEADKDEVVIRVRDTGVGIPPDLLGSVFNLFTQGERSLARSEGGLGVGLTLVRQLVELHGGSIRAFSAGANQGSEFAARFPLHQKTNAAPQPLSPDRSREQGEPSSPSRADGPAVGKVANVAKVAQVAEVAQRRILIVDDNVDAADSLCELLQLSGHDVRVLHQGVAALHATRDFHPEIVLLDIGLPGMNGYEVAERLRGECGYRGLLVALTGYGTEKDRQRSHQAGFNEHLVKPVNLQTLEELIQRYE